MNVLNLLPLDDAQRAVLMAGAPAATFTHASRTDVTDDQIARADVIVGNLAPTRLAAATNLKLLQLNSAGYDKYSGPGILPAGAPAMRTARWASSRGSRLSTFMGGSPLLGVSGGSNA